MKARWIVVAVALIASIALPAQAQRIPGRDRGGSPREAMGRDRERDPSKNAVAPGSQEPFSALERELPSLKVDLLLGAGQLEAWSAFERDVKDVAELDRTRRKHLLGLRMSGRVPDGMSVLASLVEDERLKLEALGDLKRHAESLYALLDPRQRDMLDRRIVQSQTEPLGR